MSFSSLAYRRRPDSKTTFNEARFLFGTRCVQAIDELPPDDLDTMLEDRRAPFRVDRLGSMVDGDVE